MTATSTAEPKFDNDVVPFRHQKQFSSAPWIYKHIEDFFLIGGYGCGKSFSIVLLILNIVDVYNGYEITVGLGSVTISLFRKTIWVDLERMLKISGSIYTYDKQQNILRIGTISFQIIPLENPGDIFAYNFSIFIGDEIDELPQDKAILTFTAVHERTRVKLPDGRDSFACFATTAQGYKGCYQITTDLRKKKSGHIIIRGHTRDNTSLSKKYLRTLESLYTENERQAFLEGKFINLSTGRVYGDYDEEKNRKENFTIEPDEKVYVGQDMNAGFCWGVALVKRNGRLKIHKCFNFKSLRTAPSELRSFYTSNEIFWYPDASAEEIIMAYNKEVMDNNIKVRMSPQNPSIIERTFVVNKMFYTGLMDMNNSELTNDLDMALKIRQFDDKGEPAKGRGEKSPDHVCDALEYVVFRMVSSDADFFHIWDVAKKMNQAQKIRIGKVA